METRAEHALYEAALLYGAAGWRVFPCGPDKRPLTKHGFKDASADPRLIGGWWASGDHNIGFAIPDGMLVLDFDPRNGAPEPEEFFFHATQRVLTPAGGHHLYFNVPTGLEFAGQWLKGIDVKAGGKGYVLLPPSRTPAGAYSWYYGDYDAEDMDRTKAAINDLPGWMLEQLMKTTTANTLAAGAVDSAKPTFPWDIGTNYGTGALEQQLGNLAMAQEGERNQRLNRVGYRVGQLVAGGELSNPDAALAAVAGIAEYIGLERWEVGPTLRSAYEAGLENPWRRK